MATSPALPGNSNLTWRRVALMIVATALLIYLADFAWYELRLHVPKLGTARSSVHRIRLLAIPNKGDKTTYELDMVHPEDDVPCSHSLFPQGGAKPCWYVTRHVNDPIPI